MFEKIRSFFRARGEVTNKGATGRRVSDLQDSPEWIWVQSPDFTNDLAIYAYREWISTAIDRVAELCVSVPMIVREAGGLGVYEDHPLLALLGTYGRPNRLQDSFEFMEAHFKRMDIWGNDVWFWQSEFGGAPDEVYQLDMRNVQIRVVDGLQWYFYNVGGVEHRISPEQVTHFRRSNPTATGVFWGMSAVEKLRNVAETDRLMTKWNQSFFESGAPNGIMIVDADLVDSKQARQMESEFNENPRGKRRLAVIRARQGSAVWHEALMKQRDLDFNDGRLMTRQAAFDALGFHVGAVSEASTEAHARVAEALVRESAWIRHRRTASALNTALEFWPGAGQYRVDFHDVRATDWERESKKLQAVMPYMTINEVRSHYLELGPLPRGDRFAEVSVPNELAVEERITTDA
ncbi:MAG: phage portal protein [Chloroflexi bacterium]|nr:phage portal protein [Chloroflexota bacterium]